MWIHLILEIRYTPKQGIYVQLNLVQWVSALNLDLTILDQSITHLIFEASVDTDADILV